MFYWSGFETTMVLSALTSIVVSVLPLRTTTGKQRLIGLVIGAAAIVAALFTSSLSSFTFPTIILIGPALYALWLVANFFRSGGGSMAERLSEQARQNYVGQQQAAGVPPQFTQDAGAPQYAPGPQYGQAPSQPQYGQAPGQPQYGQAPNPQYVQAPNPQYGQAPNPQYGQAPGQQQFAPTPGQQQFAPTPGQAPGVPGGPAAPAQPLGYDQAANYAAQLQQQAQAAGHDPQQYLANGGDNDALRAALEQAQALQQQPGQPGQRPQQ